MTFEADLRTHLLDESVTTYIGDRIHASKLPDYPEAYPLPAMTYTFVFGDPVNSLDGFEGIVRFRLQADLWASTYDAAESAARAVRDRMLTATGRPFGCVLVGDPALIDYETETRRHRRTIEFSCRYEE